MDWIKKLTTRHNTAARLSAEPNQYLELLLTERPKFHGREHAGTEHYAIADDVLRWITKHVAPGARTLETGCGYSTVVFALVSNEHTAISPFPQEHNLIKHWCTSHGISVEQIHFLAAPSQNTVYNLPDIPLDVVLIDGDHAFPAPFIDWYYTADLLKCGGLLIVDDTQLTTAKILKDFLSHEKDRWSCHAELGKTTIFKKLLSSPVARGIPWTKQPYVKSTV